VSIFNVCMERIAFHTKVFFDLYHSAFDSVTCTTGMRSSVIDVSTGLLCGPCAEEDEEKNESHQRQL
jgi:hypothetical protein